MTFNYSGEAEETGQENTDIQNVDEDVEGNIEHMLDCSRDDPMPGRIVPSVICPEEFQDASLKQL